MPKGPYTPDEAATIISPLIECGIGIVIIGRWEIEAYLDDHPSEKTAEYLDWRKKNPPTGPLDISCSFADQTLVESVLAEHGFTSREDADFGTIFENHRGETVSLSFFRLAPDGGRIYPPLGPNDEELYCPPQMISSGRLGSVPVRTEGPPSTWMNNNS